MGGRGGFRVWGVFIFAKVRFASFAVLGPFTNGPYDTVAVPVFVDGGCGMAVSLRGGVVVGGVLLAPPLGHPPLLSGVLGFACSRPLTPSTKGAGGLQSRLCRTRLGLLALPYRLRLGFGLRAEFLAGLIRFGGCCRGGMWARFGGFWRMLVLCMAGCICVR